MEIKKSYVEPVSRERDLFLEVAFTVSGTIEDGTVTEYGDDFWS